MSAEKILRDHAKFIKWCEQVAATSLDLVIMAEPSLANLSEEERVAFRSGAVAASGTALGYLKDRGLLNIEEFIDQLKD